MAGGGAGDCGQRAARPAGCELSHPLRPPAGLLQPETVAGGAPRQVAAGADRYGLAGLPGGGSDCGLVQRGVSDRSAEPHDSPRRRGSR